MLYRSAPLGEQATSSRWVPAASIVAALILAIALPFLAPGFLTRLTAQFLPLVLLAVSVDLLWGESRIISFGHAAFFAAGGYVGGLILKGARGDVVGAQVQFLLTGAEKPWLDRTLEQAHAVQVLGVPLLALLIPPLVTGLVGLVIAVVVFRVSSPDIYVPLITLGIGVVASLWFNSVPELGGSNGLSGIPSLSGSIGGLAREQTSYLLTLALTALTILGYGVFRRSRIGLLWRALGDDSVRLEAFGYPIWRIRVMGFAASAALAGLAGVLFAAAAGYMGPALAGVLFGTQAVIWVAVGGSGTLFGPVIGVMAVKWGEHVLSSQLGLQDTWQLFLGLLLILVVLVAPQGLAGLFEEVSWRSKSRRRASAAPSAPGGEGEGR